MYEYFLESCIESLDEAVISQQNGAHQLELCSRLDLDGLTPSIDLLRQILKHVDIPVKVMIRPHHNGFEYSETDSILIRHQINTFKTHNINGIVFGALKDKRLDLELISEVAKWASPLDVTIHKAIDLCEYPLEEITKLKNFPNIKYILSSGQKAEAIKGIDMLTKMKKACGHKLQLIVAGKVTQENLQYLHKKIGAEYYHGRKVVENKKVD
ncbi:MAG: copper homeostasis protein CutC [Saprospiraceae bacterium]|nr:copper homeostasis protein CutC [Saprospiraceae bacterium]